ncbi:MAG TPA: MFS transporter [Oceanospirillales bacterium]|nr:MFS transporter [Oceanospirillaceae bacterium]HBS43125.1 MFS transporter [Oceanospirillales bacterium]|tara:strand:- start:1370 stop:2518 length:1149 start_codon:yes stop_codon:yes gene_type:complete
MTSNTPFALFYGLYFALVGCIVPFWGLYLQHLDFSAHDIGVLMALFGVVRILGPNIWTAQAHHFRSPVSMVRWASVITVVLFCAIFLADNVWTVGLVMFAYGFFWSALLPQYESLCMQHIQQRVDVYSRIRLWGSVTFILVVAGLGALFDVISIATLPLFMLVLMLLVTVNGWLLPTYESEAAGDGQKPQFRQHLLSVPVLGFVLVNLLLYLSHGPYYTFFSIFLEEHGYSNTEIGLFWTVGVVAEVWLFWKFGRLLPLLSWRGWMIFCLLLTALRWIVVGLAVDSLWLLGLAQTIHAFSYGAMHAVSMRYVQTLFPGALRSRGQALYSSVGFGAGGALGAYVSGLLWEPLGGAGVFLLAALAALAALPVVWFMLPRERVTE